ncbi:MAG: hypothetical protein RBT59_06790, partial [Arcobacteraceae bacterium]|nr:hypothetical protein [Arcobacteraceae bacterium]
KKFKRDKEIEMIDIDEIEKLTRFPTYFQYLKLSFLKSAHYLIMICLFLYWNNVSVIFPIVAFLCLSSLLYRIDLKIFYAFGKRKSKRLKICT